MINTKELIIETIKGYESETAVWNLVCSWLEDINWHGENARLLELMPKWIGQRLELQQNMSYVLYPSDYSKQYIESIKNDPDYLDAEKAIASGHDGGMYDFHKSSQDYSFISRISKWGIVGSEWKSGGSGMAFVDELLELITTRCKEIEEENRKNRIAYSSD